MQSKSSEANDGDLSQRQAFFFLIGMMVAGLGILYYGITLLILASFVILGSLAIGVFLVLRSYETGDTEYRAISGEIEQLSNDASFDISEELIIWDKLKYTKGIGTRIAGQNSDIEDVHHRLVIAREELGQAETPIHRIEAVLTADSILATAKELRASA